MDPKVMKFLLYCLMYVWYGVAITGVGPLIPYHSIVSGKPQTDYSFLFFLRAIGYITGGMLSKKVTQFDLSYHQLLSIFMAICSVFLGMSAISYEMWWLGLCLLGTSICTTIMNVLANLCVMRLFQDEGSHSLDFWIQLLHTGFSAGGLVGPLIVVMFEENSFAAVGVCMLLTTPVFLFSVSPQLKHRQMESAKQIELTQVLHTANNNAHGNTTESNKTPQNNPFAIPYEAELMTCLIYVVYIGIEVGFGSWVPTYTVLTGAGDPEDASFASSLFWISNTFFRLLFLYVKGTITDRLRNLMGCLVVSTGILAIASIFLHYHWFCAFVGSVAIGACLACMYALFLTLPQEYNLQLTPSNTANFVMSASLGEGLLTMPIGYVMKLLGQSSLFGLIFGGSGILWVLFERVVVVYSERKKTLVKLGLIK